MYNTLTRLGLLVPALLASGTALAADPLPDSLSVQTIVDVTKEMPATDAIMGFYDHTGALVATCVTGDPTELVSNSQTHWLVNGGESHWQCTQDSLADGDGIAVFASQEHSEAWITVPDGGELLLYTVADDVKVGAIFPSQNVVWFDIDGEEPTWLDANKYDAWLAGASAQLLSL